MRSKQVSRGVSVVVVVFAPGEGVRCGDEQVVAGFVEFWLYISRVI